MNKKNSIENIVDKLVSAQVRYFLQQFQALSENKGSLTLLLKSQLQAYVKQPLNNAVKIESLEGMLLSLWNSEGFLETISPAICADLILQQYETLCHSNWVWQDLVTEEWLKMLAARIADQPELRALLIESILHSEAYRQLISEVLYAAIRSFFQQDSLLTKLPGMGSLMKLGRLGLGKMAPGLEEWVEPLAKSFISHYVETALMISKQSLMKSLTKERIQHLADHLWQQLHHQPIAHLISNANMTMLETHLKEGAVNWQDMKLKPANQAIALQLTQGFAKHLVAIPIDQCLAMMGLDYESLCVLMAEFLASILRHLIDTSQLEDTIRRVIEPSFQSKDLHTVLADLV